MNILNEVTALESSAPVRAEYDQLVSTSHAPAPGDAERLVAAARAAGIPIERVKLDLEAHAAAIELAAARAKLAEVRAQVAEAESLHRRLAAVPEYAVIQLHVCELCLTHDWTGRDGEKARATQAAYLRLRGFCQTASNPNEWCDSNGVRHFHADALALAAAGDVSAIEEMRRTMHEEAARRMAVAAAAPAPAR